MSENISLNDYQKKQEDILYGNGTHQTHDMFLDPTDMWLGCLTCKQLRNNFENQELKWPCFGQYGRKLTLCGSTKFKDEYLQWNKNLSLMGYIVYSVAFFGHADNEPLTVIQKHNLDRVHIEKIKNSGAIFVVDVDGYVGDSTKKEIEFAKENDKQIFYLSEILNNE